MSLNPIDSEFDDDALREMFTGDIPLRKQISYYLDENFMSPSVVAELRSQGIATTTAAMRDFASEDSDFLVLSDARSITAVIVTRDKGYEVLHNRIQSIEGASHAGIMLFSWRYSLPQIVSTLARYFEKYDGDPVNFMNQLFKFGR